MRRSSLFSAFVFGICFVNGVLAESQSDYVRGWLICGPFKNSNLETEYFESEAKIEPKAGQISGGREWKVCSSFEDQINFEEPEVLGSRDNHDNCVAYAYVEIKSPQGRELKLLLGSDDGIKAWLNGKNILTHEAARGFTADEDKLNIILEPGWNRLLFKISNLRGGWCFSARLCDQNNLPVRDLEYRPKTLRALPVKEATASSVEGGGTNFSPANAVDNGLSTRWNSLGKDPQWICLDLGAPAEINKVVLVWEAAYAKDYKIEISSDKENWTDIYSTSSGGGGREVILLKKPRTARYIRLYATKRANESWGYSLMEFQVFGQS